MSGINWTALIILVVLFGAVTIMGFLATRWRRPTSMESLDEWGLGGRSFGTWITWFLLGGDLYTAYTFVAVPAAMFATGAVAGFFAVPYTIVLYPIIFVFMARLWSVSHRHGYVTPADFVKGRYGSRHLSLAVAVTGFLATMPYIALQLVGIQAVLEVVGLGGGDNIIAKDAPLFIAFALLAAYTYSSGLRAPGGHRVRQGHPDLPRHHRRDHLPAHQGRRLGRDLRCGRGEDGDDRTRRREKPTGAFIPGSTQMWAYATLGLGSALALFMYPHSITATLSSSSRNTIRRNAAILPAYSFVLGLLALLGWVAIAAGTKPIGLDGKPNPQLVIPQLFEDMFPGWFAGIAFAAIAIGALVPAAIMSIAAANTFTRNIYKEFLKPDATPQAGGQGLQAGVARRQGLRARLRAPARQAERDQLPAPRWHLDPPDVPGDRVRPLHPLVPPLGAARRLGRRHGLRHVRRPTTSSTRSRAPTSAARSPTSRASRRWATSP